MSLSLYEIAESWSTTSNENVALFKDAFHKAYPNAPIAPIGIIRDDSCLTRTDIRNGKKPSLKLAYANVKTPFVYKLNPSSEFTRQPIQNELKIKKHGFKNKKK
jgi:hypothetical protein